MVEPDVQENWLKLFREFCKQNFLQKAIRTKFIAGSPSTAGMMAYTFALSQGLDNEEAFQFASYISDRQAILKSFFSTNFGGGDMGKQETLADLLDADLGELRKSLGTENEELQDDELMKSTSKGKKGKDDDENDDEAEDEDDGDDEGTEKSLKTDFSKSLAENPENAQALEVSDFLLNISEEIGYAMDGFTKSLGHVAKQQASSTKALITAIDVVKSLTEKVEGLQAENSELKKSLDGVMNLPIGRKGAVSQREITTIKKSLDGKPLLTRPQVGAVLMKSFEAKLIPGSTVTRFEAGVGIDHLNLPDTVLAELGLQ